MLAVLASCSCALTPPLLLNFQDFERLSFQIDREREGFVRRLRHQVAGDALSSLRPSSYALAPGSAVAITGANEGIGFAAAMFLAKEGYAPIICCRTQSKADAAAEAVRAAFGSANVGSVQVDLSSLDDVERGAEAICASAAALDAPLRGLLLNAGVWPQERRVTADGLEEGTQVCHVSHFALTRALLPELSSGGEARVVTVSSSAHELAPGVDLTDLAWNTRGWDAATAYGESKLANLLFAQELAHRAPQTSGGARVTSLAVHPGVVATSLFREFGVGATASAPSLPPQAEAMLKAFADAPPAKLLFKLPEDGCRTSCYALLAPDLPSGAYLSDCELTDVSPAAKDPAARKALWAWTEEWLAARSQLGEV